MEDEFRSKTGENSSSLMKKLIKWTRYLKVEGSESVEEKTFLKDFSDGLLLLRILERIKPGSVDWKKVNLNCSNKFRMLDNCTYFSTQVKEIDMPEGLFKGKEIVAMDSKIILNILWMMMRQSFIIIHGAQTEEELRKHEQQFEDVVKAPVEIEYPDQDYLKLIFYQGDEGEVFVAFEEDDLDCPLLPDNFSFLVSPPPAKLGHLFPVVRPVAPAERNHQLNKRKRRIENIPEKESQSLPEGSINLALNPTNEYRDSTICNKKEQVEPICLADKSYQSNSVNFKNEAAVTLTRPKRSIRKERIRREMVSERSGPEASMSRMTRGVTESQKRPEVIPIILPGKVRSSVKAEEGNLGEVKGLGSKLSADSKPSKSRMVGGLQSEYSEVEMSVELPAKYSQGSGFHVSELVQEESQKGMESAARSEELSHEICNLSDKLSILNTASPAFDAPDKRQFRMFKVPQSKPEVFFLLKLQHLFTKNCMYRVMKTHREFIGHYCPEYLKHLEMKRFTSNCSPIEGNSSFSFEEVKKRVTKLLDDSKKLDNGLIIFLAKLIDCPNLSEMVKISLKPSTYLKHDRFDLKDKIIYNRVRNLILHDRKTPKFKIVKTEIQDVEKPYLDLSAFNKGGSERNKFYKAALTYRLDKTDMLPTSDQAKIGTLFSRFVQQKGDLNNKAAILDYLHLVRA